MPFDLVGELISTYKPPPQKMVARMETLARTIPDDAKEDVFNAILEELGANYMVGANNITDACKKLGVPFSETHYIPTMIGLAITAVGNSSIIPPRQMMIRSINTFMTFAPIAG